MVVLKTLLRSKLLKAGLFSNVAAMSVCMKKELQFIANVNLFTIADLLLSDSNATYQGTF